MEWSGAGSAQCSPFGSQGTSNVTSKKAGCRRSWSLLEERLLIQAFQDIIACGWKTPNGFRTGFIPQLEARMRQALPHTDLRGDPHIMSKYGSWKKTYREVFTVLSKTGMGWNSTTKTVQATPEYWTCLEQTTPHLSYIREKPFPYYEVWVEMYGKDTATGNNAFDFQEAANHVSLTQVNEYVEDNANGSPPAMQTDQTGASHSGTRPAAQEANTSKGKRKRVDATEDLVEIMSTHWKNATDAIIEVANALKTEVIATQNRKKLCEAIRDLPITLTRTQRIRATSVLAKQKDQMDIFFEYSEEERCDLVYLALDNQLV